MRFFERGGVEEAKFGSDFGLTKFWERKDTLAISRLVSGNGLGSRSQVGFLPRLLRWED